MLLKVDNLLKSLDFHPFPWHFNVKFISKLRTEAYFRYLKRTCQDKFDYNLEHNLEISY